MSPSTGGNGVCYQVVTSNCYYLVTSMSSVSGNLGLTSTTWCPPWRRLSRSRPLDRRRSDIERLTAGRSLCYSSVTSALLLAGNIMSRTDPPDSAPAQISPDTTVGSRREASAAGAYPHQCDGVVPHAGDRCGRCRNHCRACELQQDDALPALWLERRAVVRVPAAERRQRCRTLAISRETISRRSAAAAARLGRRGNRRGIFGRQCVSVGQCRGRAQGP